MDNEPRELKPYSMAVSVATGSTVPTPPPSEKATEVIPIMIFAPSRTADAVRDVRPRVLAEVEPVIEKKTAHEIIAENAAKYAAETQEAETPADVDPKAVTSSATDSASDSGSGSSETPPSPTEPANPTHPSSLSAEPVTPASAEKESSPSDPSLSLSTSLGFQPPPAWELEPLPAALISSSQDAEKPAN